MNTLDEFKVDFTTQNQWRYLILLAFVFGGLGAGLFMFSWYYDFIPGLVMGLFIVVFLKGGAHLMYLGRPMRFFRAFVRPQSSWISRGMIALGIFAVFGVLYTAPRLGWGFLSWIPYAKDSGIETIFGILALIGGFGVMVYTGFLMSTQSRMPFWNSTILPVLFVFYAFMGGIDLIFMYMAVFGEHVGVNIEFLERLQIALTGGALLLFWAYIGVMSSSTLAAKESVRRLLRGSEAPLFVGGVLIVGLIIPLGVTASLVFSNQTVLLATGLAGLLTLIGSFLFRLSLLRVGVYSPPI